MSFYILKQLATMTSIDETVPFTSNMSAHWLIERPGLTSHAWHVIVWFVMFVGIVGNVFVFLWRCMRKDSRRRVISLVICSLALADLLWYCRQLLQEVIILYPIFVADENQGFEFSERDRRLCLSSTFIGYVSCNAIMLSVLAIGLHCYMTLRGSRFRNKFIVLLVLVAWIVSIGVATSAVRESAMHLLPSDDVTKSPIRFDRGAYSLIIMIGCLEPFTEERMTMYPIVVSSINALCSIICAVVYICFWLKIRKSDFDPRNSGCQELKGLQIRLTIISAISLICWWPSFILYLTYYFQKKLLLSDPPPLPAVEIILLLTAVVSAVNPFVYTIASKTVLKRTGFLCSFNFCRRRNDKETIKVYFPRYDFKKRRFWKCRRFCKRCCCGSFHFSTAVSDDNVEEIRLPLLDDSEITEETKLFSETCRNSELQERD
ncbi:thyrotropin receptor-like [Corticium candelabrum]|uniref:thyrotropin receptor-like n=1 Tax=Corticium candelabrum TaxID=121492 RepID=UPI002E2560EE|nr:thyrotropin receptor-like [Corticium candelabrum]